MHDIFFNISVWKFPTRLGYKGDDNIQTSVDRDIFVIKRLIILGGIDIFNAWGCDDYKVVLFIFRKCIFEISLVVDKGFN